MITSPQAGALFETLVFAEIFKFIQNHGKDWQLYLWRTKESEEIDFLIATKSGEIIALDAKMSIQNIQPVKLPKSFKTLFSQVKNVILVTFGGKKIQLSKECLAVPINQLHEFLSKV